MRSSLRRNTQLLRSLESRRPITLPPRASSSPYSICASCRRALFPSAAPIATQSRFQSSSSSPQPSSSTTPAQNPPPPKTHYEFFPLTLPEGPPPSGPFHIDARTLRKEFLQLQAVAHPDRHHSHLKTRAEGTSARINEAYKTLQNPLLRTQYLLHLRGIDVAVDETAKVEDPELLMEVMEAREQIDEAEHEGELGSVREANEERIRRSEEVLDKAFKEDDLETAREESVRLRYWVNIKESLDAWEHGKGGGLNQH